MSEFAGKVHAELVKMRRRLYREKLRERAIARDKRSDQYGTKSFGVTTDREVGAELAYDIALRELDRVFVEIWGRVAR